MTLWREALPADPMNTFQAEPWGSPATPEATSCSADPTPTSQGGSAAHEACRAGREELLPTFLLPGRSPEVQTARLSLEACLRPPGIVPAGSIPTPPQLPPGPPIPDGFGVMIRRTLKRMVGKVLLLTQPIPEQNPVPCQLPHSCLAVVRGVLFIGRLRNRPQCQCHRSPPPHLSRSGLVTGPTGQCQWPSALSSCCSFSKVRPSVSVTGFCFCPSSSVLAVSLAQLRVAAPPHRHTLSCRH